MFVGHYAPAFAVKAIRPSIPLWSLFIAAQLVDFFFFVFVPLGIEKMRIVPGFTASMPLDLYYMPYTHSLLAAIIWSVVGALVFAVFQRSDGWVTAGLFGAVVLSHWILDLLVHIPDLPLYDDAMKVGFGIWNFPAIAFVLEGALLFGGIWLYLRNTNMESPAKLYKTVAFGLVMLVILAVVFFGPVPASNIEMSIATLVAYAIFTLVAYLLDERVPIAETH